MATNLVLDIATQMQLLRVLENQYISPRHTLVHDLIKRLQANAKT